MNYECLHSFIQHLEESDQLRRVTAGVDPYLEAATLINQECKSSTNRALLFDEIKGSAMPLVANLFGSAARTASALGVDESHALQERFRLALAEHRELSSADALSKVVADHAGQYQVEEAVPCFSRQITEQGFDALPALHSWPEDGGRYLTMGQIISRSPDTGVQNCGLYRLQLIDKQRALLRCHAGSGGAEHLAAWHAQGEPMPLSIVLGGPPALLWAAALPLPADTGELDFVQYLLRQPVALSRCQTNDLLVPSTAEIVIEAEVRPDEVGLEGPFANHTGYYSEAAPAPVVRLKRLFVREQAIYPCTLVGPPPMENVQLGLAAQEFMLPMLQHDFPWLSDLHLPAEGIYHNAVLVSVKERKMAAAEICRQLSDSRYLRRCRLVVIVDRDCDVRAANEVYWNLLNAGSWERVVKIAGSTLLLDARPDQERLRIRQ